MSRFHLPSERNSPWPLRPRRTSTTFTVARASVKRASGTPRREATGPGRPGEAAAAEAWNKAAFETHSLDETMKALGGGTPVASKDIVFFSTPDIAENGAVVPIGIVSNVQ